MIRLNSRTHTNKAFGNLLTIAYVLCQCSTPFFRRTSYVITFKFHFPPRIETMEMYHWKSAQIIVIWQDATNIDICLIYGMLYYSGHFCLREVKRTIFLKLKYNRTLKVSCPPQVISHWSVESLTFTTRQFIIPA